MLTADEFYQLYTVEAFVAESVQRWASFVAAAQDAHAVSIIESYPFQSTVRILLQMHAPWGRIDAYAQEVEEIIQSTRVGLPRRPTG
jgi:hypothetical protein